MKRIALGTSIAGLFTVVMLWAAAVAAAGVADTRHNLAATGPGAVKASQESQVCIFCHTPHGGSPVAPLWNRSSPGTAYLPYSSSTAVARPGQPTGASLLCLSCHDGTIALGSVLSRTVPIAMAGGTSTMPPGRSRIGTDLTHDHPVSFPYTAALAAQQGELVNPAALPPKVRLDAGGQLQCTSCHDAHDDSFGNFLVMPNVGSQLCIQCHTQPSWSSSPHSTSTRTWNGAGTDPWPLRSWSTVAENGCENCHLPHADAGGPRLLANATEDHTCAACHNGNVAVDNVMAAFAAASIHPIAASSRVHDPAEPAVIANRHVECSDCHDAHAARGGADPLQGALANVRGVDINGVTVVPIRNTSELCFRCHGDSPGAPVARTPRQLTQVNTRLEFQPTNPSFHPVGSPGRNTDVPSLIAPLSTASVIQCSSCHNSNTAPSVGGTGAEGPHGSAYAPLLARRYDTAVNTPESPAAYATCYACHDRTSILSDSSFKEHRKHIVDESLPCNACHDPHGISAVQGNATNNSNLINFDISLVQANGNGLLRFRDTGRFHGSCDLLCHGKQHDNESY
jgi:predicted CXXCH cytochrome family protein